MELTELTGLTDMDISERADGILARMEENRRQIYDLLGSVKANEAAPGIAASDGFALGALSLKDMRVACIADKFTYEGYAPECSLCYITPENWQAEIEAFSPDLMFIESAWYGIDDKWHTKLIHMGIEYYNLCRYCKKLGIPIAFWNKEDPVWTSEFMGAARLADFVFTTDVDMIRHYKTLLGHNRVYHLHFAAQPKYLNPLEKFARRDKFCFAGSYYHNYAERSAVFDAFAYFFITGKGLDIYDRHYENARPEHAFPERYNPYILGKLDFEEIDAAYKGYVYNINMNSVAQSQSMFARRVIDLLASNTVAVGNFAKGLKNYFGDLTISTDSVEELQSKLEKYCSDETSVKKYRLAGLRRVLSAHLYKDRLAYIAKKVFGADLLPPMPEITVFALAKTDKESEYIKSCFGRQTYPYKKLEINPDPAALLGDYRGYAAVFDKNDCYAPNYLTDLALSTRWSDCEGVGKSSFYQKTDGKIELKGLFGYSIVSALSPRRAIFKTGFLADKTTLWFLKAGNIELPNTLLSVDEFNYCADTDEIDGIFADFSEIDIVDQGIDPETLTEISENIFPAASGGPGSLFIGAREMLDSCPDLSSKKFTALLQGDSGDSMRIDSGLSPEAFDYFYLKNKYAVSRYVHNGKIRVCFAGGAYGTAVMGTCLFFDAGNARIGSQNIRLNFSEEMQIPPNTESVSFGFRVKGTGTAVIKKIYTENVPAGSAVPDKEPGCFIPSSDTLVITNHYPDRENLYRNMFVHQRLLSYLKTGRKYDVMRILPYQKKLFREFEGISVSDGDYNLLLEALQCDNIRTLAVHFLDVQMWNAIKPVIETGKKRLLIWCHGSEIQPWQRREYNYKDENDREIAKIQSEAREKLWGGVFETALRRDNIRFIFVSEYFAKEVAEDYGISLPREKYSVIHNAIDTENFSYELKPPEQRKRVLSIRPFASRQYANDVSVNAILELSGYKEFEDMEFLIAGQGILFDELTEPLKKFPNVTIEKSYFNHKEIADLHKKYGVCLIPTRWDSHGVSRDEAMSSGLVPVTNPVAAIPEFCADENDSLLVPAEDYKAAAEAMLRLYRSPKLFSKLSCNAAQRVRNQSAAEIVIKKEIELIEGEKS